MVLSAREEMNAFSYSEALFLWTMSRSQCQKFDCELLVRNFNQNFQD